MVNQLRIQDLSLGGNDPWGAPTSDTGAFRWKLCENERIGSLWGGGGEGSAPAASPRSDTVNGMFTCGCNAATNEVKYNEAFKINLEAVIQRI